ALSANWAERNNDGHLVLKKPNISVLVFEIILKFHQINGAEFMLEVWPYRYLLSESLVEDLLLCYLVPGAVPYYHTFPIRLGNVNFKIDSVIINKRNAPLFTKWLDKKDVDNKSSQKSTYNFNLLFRSSIDGFSAQTFHNKCDNK
ncbi:37843_t:CDS:2, partial [Gigaspora margarita]